MAATTTSAAVITSLSGTLFPRFQFRSHESARPSRGVEKPSVTPLQRVGSTIPSPECSRGVVQQGRRQESVSLCTTPERVDVEELSALLGAARHNCQQFPRLQEDGAVAPVNPLKLRRALRHSTVVAALYVDAAPDEEDEPPARWHNIWTPRPRSLVAFGRAVSDRTLAASIFDVVVAPSHQRSGYASQVVRRIIRDLRRLGISDISVTPPPELRPFFEHCGFGPDALKSITMMYTRGPSGSEETLETKVCGRKALLIPPPLRSGSRHPHHVS